MLLDIFQIRWLEFSQGWQKQSRNWNDTRTIRENGKESTVNNACFCLQILLIYQYEINIYNTYFERLGNDIKWNLGGWSAHDWIRQETEAQLQVRFRLNSKKLPSKCNSETVKKGNLIQDVLFKLSKNMFTIGLYRKYYSKCNSETLFKI